MNNSLYQIRTDYEDAIERAITEELEDFSELEALSESLGEKVENVALYIKNMEQLAKSIKEEEENLKARRQAIEKRNDKLKEYLTSNMLAVGMNKHETSKIKVSFRKSSSVEVEDVEALPLRYRNEKITITADKTAIRNALKEGVLLPGCSIIEKESIQIK